ncbi:MULTISPECIES: restriction endonuclease subunit S [unclassified Sphingomonas]|uniref:restriction endonuclease subunit S n=1 Tax=unclassified Sphingomonas TaxID=196159 RepID=UPI00285E01FF|nr:MULTISPECIES: restriction endonuclease subunit S [unclassified Sphingomonas]MDR6114129.1 restriction endonuclease S subunit [Sphingomonas sp. SORGH_AS_0789]MDR6148511.1 restriction endonuclease S subunit [Sphingomonas sp. SORGH_AS_0742]
MQWVGDVPSHWAVVPLKHVAALIAGQSPNSADCNEEGAGLPFLQGCAEFGEQHPTPRQYCELPPKQAIEGDLLLSVRAPVGELNIADQRYGIGRGLCAIRPVSGEFSFLRHVIAASIKPLQSVATGSTYQAVSSEQIGSLRTPKPPADEQIIIAAFLDRETSKIDALIEEQRRLIVLLKEKRQAVISHAVTKGLDPNAPMKDSGIEWLGEVPAHWQILPLRRVVRQFVDYRGATPNKVSEGVPLITATQIKHGRIDHSLDPVFISEEEYAERMTRGFPAVGDLLLTTEAPLGEVALVDEERVAPGQRIILMKMADHLMTSGYLHAHFRSDFGQSELWTRASGSTASGIRADRLRGSAVLVPPLDEQLRIVSHIQQQTSAFDNVFAVVTRGIQLLNERRAALISAAVTGKIDVRESAKVLPFPLHRAQARGLIATEIIERSAHQSTFGRVKLQKIAFLAEAHIGISELAGSYTREAAGPLDRALIEEMESGAQSIAGIEWEQPGGAGTTVSYRLGQQRGAHRHELAQWLGEDRTAKFDKLIGDFAALSTKEAEAVATLYGVWNDALSEGASPTDNEIISGFLNDWHPEKRAKFRASELPEWLGWMRRHGIVPTGSGPKTTTGRLFV